MRKLLLIAALLFAATSVMAGNVDLSTAQTKAANFLKSKAPQGRLMTSAPTVKWTHEVKNSSNASLAAYYIVNTDKGYVIIAGDDRAREILAYGNKPLTDLNDIPDNMQFFLNLYKAEMEYLQAHPGLIVNKNIKNGGVSIEPLLQTAWAQGKPYNMRCPKVGRDYCKTGCTATSLAQVMKYWEYPEKAPAMAGYQCPDSKINVDALPEYTFDWENMWDTYEDVDVDRLPEVNKDAVAWLMRYVGQAENIDYNTDKSGTGNEYIAQALQIFGYDEDAHYVLQYNFFESMSNPPQNYTDDEWANMIQSELIARRPLVYCAFDMSSDSAGISGHAFNVDGYDAVNDMYHVNFGMRSELNAFYALNAFRIDDFIVYDFWPSMYVGVQPPGLSTDPRILVSTMEVNMECYTGETVTDTITVKGQYLTEGIAVTLDDENGVFSTNVTSIAFDQVGNATIVVTYAPQAVGTHNATITLTSEGANDKVITLKGTATPAPLVVYDPKMLPADSTYITKTSFRADWTDQTAAENVLSYTLDVKEKPGAGGLLADVDWSNASGSAASALPEGWTYGDYSIFFDEGGIAITTDSYIKTDVLDLSGIGKVTVVLRAKNYYGWTASTITVKTSIDQKTLDLANDYADYTIVLNCAESDQVEFFATAWNPTIQAIKIYAGEVTPQLRATVEGDASHYIISGITEKTYTVNGLNAESTYLFKVKAHYTDGTESAWSNTQMVTLFDNGPAPHEFEVGDVNHDHTVNIADVTALIDYLLGSGNVCTTCANVNGDDGINIADVTALIDKLLSAH